MIRIVVISFSDTLFADITGTYIQCQEFHLRVQIRFIDHSRCKHIAEKHNYIRAICHCLIHTYCSGFIRIALGFVIVELNVIFLSPCLTCFVSHLIEALVCDITGVC